MATPTLDERLDVVEQQMTAFRAEFHQTFAPIRLDLGRRILKLEAGINFILNKLSILERGEQHIDPFVDWSKCGTEDKSAESIVGGVPKELQDRDDQAAAAPGVELDGVGTSHESVPYSRNNADDLLTGGRDGALSSRVDLGSQKAPGLLELHHEQEGLESRARRDDLGLFFGCKGARVRFCWSRMTDWVRISCCICVHKAVVASLGEQELAKNNVWACPRDLVRASMLRCVKV